MRTSALVLALILSIIIVSSASANSVGSSTMEFEGTLTDNGDGTYSGVIPMIVGGGYDIYAEEGGTAMFGNDPGTGPVWTSQAIGVDHDAWPTWTPDTPDWYQYSLELYVDGSTEKWAVRNHAGATETNPWYDEGHWGAGGLIARGVPMAGLMGYADLYAVETEVGAYLSGTGTPEIPGGAAGQGGGPGAWDMDWSWGSEVVPLEYSGFDVDIQDLGSGNYRVTLTPAALTEVWVDDDFTSATLGWGVTHFASIQDGIDAVEGSTVNVADGTYTIATTLNVNKGVIIDGESEAGVVLDASGCAGYGMLITADGVVLRDMTMLPPAVNYPIHASGTGNPPDGYDGLTIEHMTIEGVHQRTAFDIHGYSNVLLSYVTAGDATGGNGIQVTGCLHVDMDNIVTHDNAWGSIAIYCSSGSYLNRGSDDVEIDGDSCTLGEGNIYSQDEFGLTNTNVTVLGYEYLVKNDVAAPGYDLFQDTLTDAAAVAAAVGADSYIVEIATGDLVVLSGMSIQAAIDAADPGDTIDVAAGTYVEQITVNKSLQLVGSGESSCTIQAPAVRTGTVVQGTNTWDYIVGVWALSGYIDAGVTGFTLDAAAQPKTVGTSGLVGAYFCDVKGTDAGLRSCTIYNFDPVEYESWGVRVHGNTWLDLDDNTLSDYTRDGIVVNGDGEGGGLDPAGIYVTHNDLTGNPLALNGIQIGYNAGAVVTENTVRDHTRSSPWAAVGLFAYETIGVTLGQSYKGNTVTNCFDGIVLLRSDYCSVSGNDLTENIAFHIGLDDSDGCLVSDNTLTSISVIPDKAISLSNGADSNIIGGSSAAYGNTITLPTTGGLLYGIYVVGTTGSGSNDIGYNTFTGGTRFVQCDGGYSGTVTVHDNVVSDCSFAGVYLNGGSGVIERNTLTNTVRPVEFWGAGSVTITDNLFDGATFEGVNAGAYSGTVTITGNAFENIGGATINNRVATHMDASGNWLGSADPAVNATEVLGLVDYTPWLGTFNDTSADPGYQGDYSVLGVDDCPQTGSTGRIQEAIGLVSGSTINVAAGTYAERLNISKSLDLIGPQDGVDPTAAGARTNPANEAIIDITGIGVMNPNVAVEIPAGVTDVMVSGFTIKGSPTSNYADESVVRIWDDDVAISDNILDGYVGVLYKGADGLDVLDNRIVANKTGVTVQPNAATDVEISGNSIALGSSPGGGESAIYGTGITGFVISGNVASGFINGKGVTGSNLTDVDVIGNTFTGNSDAVSFWGTTTFVDILSNDLSNNLRYGVNIKGQDVVITGNTINGNGDTGVNVDYHVLDTERVVVNNNSLVGNTNYGIQVDTANITETVDGEYNWWGSATGPTHTGNPTGTGDASTDGVDYDPWIGKTGGENIVCDPDPLNLNIAVSSGTIDVDYLGGGGGMVYGYSVTVTWDPLVATLTGITEGNLLSDAGTTNFFYYGTGGTRTIDCALQGAASGVTGPGELFELSFDAAGSGVSTVDVGVVAFRDNLNQPLSGFYEDDGLITADITAPVFTDVSLFNLTLGHTDEYAKDGDDLKLTADVTDDYTPLLVIDIEADLSTLLASGGSAVNPDTYDGAVATWIIPLAGVTLTGDGLKTVTVTATDWRGNPASDSDDITVDNTAPAAITGLDASPAHEEVVLVWDDASGGPTDYYGVMVRYNVWGDYPTYDLATPVYPASETAGVEALSGDYATGVTHGIVPRDIHYYSAFVYDWALNYGTVTTAGQDRATNYWLGDIATTLGNWGYNGLVNAADIGKLGGQYGQAPTGFFLECDVGPTDDNTRLGIPEPDDFVSFEDLMIFAMNYGVVAPRIVPFLAEPSVGELALALTETHRSSDGVLTLALRLEGNLGEVKGLSTELEFDGLEFLSAGLSDEMNAPVADVFFWSDAASRSAQVDLAVLGTDVTIGGSGDVAVLTFRIVDDAYTIDFASAVLRGAANDELTADLEGLSADGVPAGFKLVRNTPNPFNPVTTVGYHLPSESRVTIRVFDVTGRVVTTLVDGVVEPGRHTVVWNGTNEYGEPVGSGVYFCTMETPEYRGSHKMTLLK